MVINSRRDNSTILSVLDNKTEFLYTWPNLIYQGKYQFSVIAFTKQGPGDTATVMFNVERGKLIITTRYLSAIAN